MPNTPDDLIEVGHVMDAQGIRGQLKVRPYSSDPEALLDAENIWLASTAKSKNQTDSPHQYEVVSTRFHSGSVLLQLEAIEDRDQALQFKGFVVLMSRADFPELDEDTFYWADLIGLEVRNLKGEVLGVIEEVLDNGAQSVLSIVNDAKKQQLIPFVEPIVQTVELTTEQPGFVVVDWQADW